MGLDVSRSRESRPSTKVRDRRERARVLPRCDGIEQRDVSLLKMIEMEDPGSYKAVHFGDDVWLQIFGGTGEPSWKNGSVVGAKVYTATKLPTVPLDPTQAKYKVDGDGSPDDASGSPGSPLPNAAHAAQKLGVPTPVRATLPKGKDDAAWSFHGCGT